MSYDHTSNIREIKNVNFQVHISLLLVARTNARRYLLLFYALLFIFDLLQI